MKNHHFDRSFIKRPTDSPASTTSGQIFSTNGQTGIRVDKWVLRVDKRVLRVGKRVLRVGEEWYDWPGK